MTVDLAVCSDDCRQCIIYILICRDSVNMTNPCEIVVGGFHLCGLLSKVTYIAAVSTRAEVTAQTDYIISILGHI